MSDKCFVDTNILVYAHDRSAGVKHQRAQMLLEQLWDSGQGVLSTQVLQELCINLRRKISHPLPVDEVRLLIRDYATWEVVTNTPESVLQALDIELRYKTSFWSRRTSLGPSGTSPTIESPETLTHFPCDSESMQSGKR